MEARMSRQDRAKQFMPFAALKGYEEALRRKEKILVPRIELSEEYQEELDRQLRTVSPRDIVEIIYYDKGEYLQMTGMVGKVDKSSRILKIVDKKIGFDDLYRIQIKEFESVYKR